MERWRIIDDFPLYEISDHGRVGNVNTGHILGIYDNGHGVLQVTLRHHRKNHIRAVHKLVAEAYLDQPPPGYVVIFLDFDRTNLHWSNLKYVPRWQAVARTKQERQTEPKDPRPVLMERTGIVYANALECARALDGLENLILLTIHEEARYKGSMFRFVND